MAEKVDTQLQPQIDAIQAELAVQQPQTVQPVAEMVDQPDIGRSQMVGQPVRVQHEIAGGGSALTKPDRGEWCWYSVGWGFCVLFFPVGCLIWCTMACNYFCQPTEVRSNHPMDGRVAKAAFWTVLTWCCIAVVLYVACGRC